MDSITLLIFLIFTTVAALGYWVILIFTGPSAVRAFAIASSSTLPLSPPPSIHLLICAAPSSASARLAPSPSCPPTEKNNPP